VDLLHSRDERRVDNNTSYDGVPYNEKNPNVICLHFIVNAPPAAVLLFENAIKYKRRDISNTWQYKRICGRNAKI
jgi:hypothetical protein